MIQFDENMYEMGEKTTRFHGYLETSTLATHFVLPWFFSMDAETHHGGFYLRAGGAET